MEITQTGIAGAGGNAGRAVNGRGVGEMMDGVPAPIVRSVGRLCLYCAKAISTEDKISVCDRCFAAHHESCWERNGRCSTFRCAGLPRTMSGADLTVVLNSAYEKANEKPTECPYCASKVYAGNLQGRWKNKADGLHPAGLGLHFISKNRVPAEKGWLKKITAPKSWFLAGATLKSRSCGNCRRLFIWGNLVDDAFLQKLLEGDDERYCPHCTTALMPGQIELRKNAQGTAVFECNDVPEFSKDWFGHQILDRYVRNKWSPMVEKLPANSCPTCHYTEFAGRPIYRFQ
ncbi:MAG: RING finger protein [Chthonomonadales bacterium]